MMRLLLGLLLSFAAFAQTAEVDELQKLLDLDRFHAYVGRWSETMKGRGKIEIAKAMMTVSPGDIAAMNLSAQKLADAKHYDDLIYQILKKKFPNLNVTPNDVQWAYNFYKNKLNEAYKVGSVRNLATSPFPSLDPLPNTPVKPFDLSGEILLDVDGYVADRTTRAVFWEASKSNRAIELHVGTPGSFKEHLASQGAKIIGEVKSQARNYNPIYLVQYPGEDTFHYAITEIAGNDRVKHLAMQSQLVRWKNANGTLSPMPPVRVVGDATAKLLAEEANLKRVLQTLPPADNVLIGQKGAFERTVGSLAKVNALKALEDEYPKALAKLSEPQLKFLKKIREPGVNLTELVMKEASTVDDLYEAALPVFEKLKFPVATTGTVFNLDRGSFELSDYILEGPNGKPQRWRVFSNVWGDEVIPVAKALKETGHTQITYIGTAGALPGSGLKVGDLVVPNSAMNQFGESFVLQNADKLPTGAKTINTVVNVASPFEETTDWLQTVKGKAQAVEVETAHLGKIFSGKNDKVKTYLLISDVVGVEGETLASASSSARRKAQINAFVSMFDEAGVKGTLPVSAIKGLESWIDELAPNRDVASKFHLLREAEARGLSTKKEIQKLIDEIPGFTTARLEKALATSDQRFWLLEETIANADVSPKWSVSRQFVEGRWSPSQVPEIHLQVSSLKAEKELRAALSKLEAADKNFAKSLKVTIAREAAGSEWIRLTDLPENGLTGLYLDSALGYGGIANTQTSGGALKLVKVAPSNTGRASGTLAYFEPNKATLELLEQLQGQGSAAKILRDEIATLNKAAGPNKPWEIVFKVVDDLPAGKLAQISPVLSGQADNLTIQLLMTKQGMKNPAVVMEELIHLQQITGAPVPWKKSTELKAFVHPYHWAETVANAKAGSAQAIEKLARLELEAAQLSEDAVRFYRKKGLFAADKELIEQYLKTRTAHAEELYSEVAKAARLDWKNKKASWERAKSVFASLEKQSLKLNDLVAKGDRKGVRKLIDTYLPWDLMEPSEKKVWKDWLDAIEFPNKDKVKLVFRGMYDDTIMRAQDGTPYIMSTVLSRNQGNYTRRLRSLSTMREKFGSQALRDAYSAYNLPGAKNPGSVSVLMANHAIEAKGSPFISTASYDVATKFGPRQIGAFELEPRRFALNALAPDIYLYQKEHLTPLIIFPDEVAYFHDYAANPVPGVGPRDPVNRKKHFLAEVEKRLNRKLTPAEISGIGTDKEFLQESFEKLKPMILEPEKLPTVSCGLGAKSCDCLYKGLNALLK